MNLSNDDLERYYKIARNGVADNNSAKLVQSCLDLTNLDHSAQRQHIIELCKRASIGEPHVAAICIYPHFIPLAKDLLEETPVKIATVANFPSGNEDPNKVRDEIVHALLAGADEIDVVIPYQAYFNSKPNEVKNIIEIARDCSNERCLKIILETGELKSPQLIYQASVDAISINVDFIKTSTGKTPQGASLEAAIVMLNAIKDHNKEVGFKASGGVRTLEEAIKYINLAKNILGEDWVNPEHFRIGASSLYDDLQNYLKAN